MSSQDNSFLPKTGNYKELLSYKSDESYKTYEEFADTRDGGVVANIAHCLVHQANYLLDRQIARLEKDFLEKGGLKELMYKARIQHRANQQRS